MERSDHETAGWLLQKFHSNIAGNQPPTLQLCQRKKGNTKHNQTTTILFFTLLLTYGFLETIQIQTQEENIG